MLKLTSHLRLGLQILALTSPIFISQSFMLPAPVHACMAGSSTPTPLAQRFEQTPYVFTGIVERVYGETLSIRVGRYFKGSGPRYVTLAGFNNGSCQHTFKQNGGRYIFFAERQDQKNWQAVYDGTFGAVIPWSDQTMPELRRLGIVR